jgi:purine catabolism regulator
MSSITVREALSIGGLKKGQVVAGRKGLERPIRYVDVMEVPDAPLWIRKDEMLVTTAYAIKDNLDALQQLVGELAARGASALVIKPERYLGSLPKEMIEQAEHLDFPIITVPADVPYIDITHPILEAILNKQAQYLERSEEINRRLIRVVLEGGGFGSIAASVSDLINGDVLICDTSMKVIAKAGCPDLSLLNLQRKTQPRRLAGAIEQASAAVEIVKVSTDKDVKEFVMLPIEAENTLYGYLLVEYRGGAVEQLLLAIQHAVTVSALEFIKMRAVREAESRVQREVLDELLHGNLPATQATTQAQRLGFRFQARSIVLFGTLPEGRDRDESFGQVKSSLQRHDRSNVVLHYGDHWLALYNARTVRPVELAQEIQEVLFGKLDKAPGGFLVGTSTFCTEVTELPQAFQEARDALEVGPVIFPRACVFTYFDVGLYAIIKRIHNEQLENYCKKLLTLLKARDSNEAEILRETLLAYLETNGSLQKSAERLFVHRNTVRNRLNKLTESLGPSWKALDASTLCFSLRLCKVLQMGRKE